MCRGVVRRRPFIPPGGGLCRDVVRRRCVFWGRCIFYRGALRRSCFLHEMLMHPSRHLISRLRRQLLLEEKPYWIALRSNATTTSRREISPCGAGFHLPKADFTSPEARFHPSAGRFASSVGFAASFSSRRSHIWFALLCNASTTSRREISPCGAEFHLPKADFTPRSGISPFRRKVCLIRRLRRQLLLEAKPFCVALQRCFFTANGPFLFDMCDLRFKFKRYWCDLWGYLLAKRCILCYDDLRER